MMKLLNVSGHTNDFQARMLQEESRAMYINRTVHRLDYIWLRKMS